MIGSVSNEVVPPAIYMPQREPYNPGGYEFKTTKEPSDFVVWTYVYDVSGLQNVALRYRVDYDGAVDYANP
ncbi:MAG: hypothetical protein FJ088_15450, partial [Deltaproteobacteria bacterium]|nr:hypothetical protein [Deltaproteobacteria bacterium]